MNRLGQGGRFPVYSRAEDSLVLTTVDIFAQKKQKNIEVQQASITVASDLKKSMSLDGDMLDFNSWLPFCARSYCISPNILDYIFVPVVIMTSDTPNRNGVSFPLSTLTEWSDDCGCVAYKTWRGMPVHYEHDNENPTKAYGVIVDSFLRKLQGFGNGKVWKVVLLLAIDRTKHPDYAAQVLAGEHNAFSMGALVSGYTCSYCKAEAGKCSHISLNRPLDFYELNGKLVFRRVHGMKGIETSGVAVPAYSQASSDTLLGV